MDFIQTLFLMGFIVVVTMKVLYLRAMNRALLACNEKSRKMASRQLWLGLIPIFSLYWNFVIVKKVTGSLENEFRSRSQHASKGFPYTAGMTYCILFILSMAPYLAYLTKNIDLLNFSIQLASGASLIGMVVWIVFWGRIQGLSKELNRFAR